MYNFLIALGKKHQIHKLYKDIVWHSKQSYDPSWKELKSLTNIMKSWCVLNSKVTTNDIFEALPLVSFIFHFSLQKNFQLPNPKFVTDAQALHMHMPHWHFWLKPSNSSYSKPHMMACTRLSQVFCFTTQCNQNKTFEKPHTMHHTRLWITRNNYSCTPKGGSWYGFWK